MGYCARSHKLTDCIRKNDLNLIWPSGYDAVKPQDQENCDGTTTLLTKGTYADDNYGWKYLYPYHGKATDLETVSAVAKMLQWDETVWNLDGDLPTFR